jgi:hypothetical protein
MKERPETVTYSFYDAKKAAFLPNHTGANLMAFHPDFTYMYVFACYIGGNSDGDHVNLTTMYLFQHCIPILVLFMGYFSRVWVFQIRK